MPIKLNKGYNKIYFQNYVSSLLGTQVSPHSEHGILLSGEQLIFSVQIDHFKQKISHVQDKARTGYRFVKLTELKNGPCHLGQSEN